MAASLKDLTSMVPLLHEKRSPEPRSRLARQTVIWRAGVTEPEISTPPRIRWCSRFDSELASPLHQGTGPIAETAPARAHAKARLPQRYKGGCHACGSRRRYEIHRRW